MKTKSVLAALLVATSLLSIHAEAAKHPTPKKATTASVSVPAQEISTESPTPPTPAPAPIIEAPSARVIQYGEKDVIQLNTKLRYTTLIVLPETEQILDFSCGDKEYWVVNGNQNIAYVKPAKAGATTNLNLIAASGHIYTFLLREVSEKSGVEPDLKVFIEPKEQSMIATKDQAPRFVPASELENYREQIEIAKQETARVKTIAQAAIDGQIPQFLSSIKFSYHFNAGKKPFRIKAIWHDKKFTYIQGEPDETPTLYEIQDNKPNLVNFEYKDGIFVVQKVIDRGYLAIGKSRLLFVRHD